MLRNKSPLSKIIVFLLCAKYLSDRPRIYIEFLQLHSVSRNFYFPCLVRIDFWLHQTSGRLRRASGNVRTKRTGVLFPVDVLFPFTRRKLTAIRVRRTRLKIPNAPKAQYAHLSTLGSNINVRERSTTEVYLRPWILCKSWMQHWAVSAEETAFSL